MNQRHRAKVDVNMNRYGAHTAKSTCLRINLEASFTPVIHNEKQPMGDHQNVYVRELASPVLQIDRGYQNSWIGNHHMPQDYNSSMNMTQKKQKSKRKSKKRKIPNTRRNHPHKATRSKSVNNNRKRLEKRINFYKVQNI